MIIDFRVRPPFKGFRGSFLYRPRNPNPDPVTMPGLQIGLEPYRSFEQQSMEAFLKEMDEAGIDMAVAIGRQAPSPYGGVPNEDVAELVNTYPGRFLGIGAVDGSRGKEAVAEIDRIVDLGLRGVAMDNGYCNPPLYNDDERLFPIYARCEELGLILSLTSSIFLGPDLTYSDPVTIQRVALRFPKLKIVVPHGSWPWTTKMCAVALQCPNIYLVPDFYMHIPNMPGADEFLKAANFYLSYRLLYASSYPVRPLGQSISQFRDLAFSDDAIRQRCLGENAARLLGLST